ncbi:17672_t:CDS:2 [Acaulospora morrowiae]|uniref:17672_t:CDS:1 n=1 Tax=Acaulospora morrowiae TaxID=94023 RepID=A0A9N9HQW9_9GLOM|nr:17672_t:CDS:2 [Acaulospora morrowiae]
MAAVVIAYYAAKASAAHCGWWRRQKSLRRTMVGGGGDHGGVLCINNGGEMLWLVANVAAAGNIMKTAASFTVASIRTVVRVSRCGVQSTVAYRVAASLLRVVRHRVSSSYVVVSHPGDAASTLCYVDIGVFQWCPKLVSSFRQYTEHMAAFRRPDGNLVLPCRPELCTTFPGVYVVRPSTAYGMVVSRSAD